MAINRQVARPSLLIWNTTPAHRKDDSAMEEYTGSPAEYWNFMQILGTTP